MRIAYADPPYIGCARLYAGGVEVNHALLIQHLCNDFDAWALSCHSPSLKTLLPMCPENARVAAWVKPFAVFKPNVSPAYTWEPVIFVPGRRATRDERTARDFISCSITLKKGLVGAKPAAFCFWLFDLLGCVPGDDFADLFPGTGAVMNAWRRFNGLTIQGVQHGLFD